MPFLALLLAAAVASTKPVPAPPVFVSGVHAVTFHAPERAWICPLSPDWVGSDHGTIMFLEAPTACEGTGYPSSARHISDDRLVPSIDIFYAYDMGDDIPPEPCPEFGHTRLLNARHPLCRQTVDGGVRVWINGVYMADEKIDVTVTLTTTAARLDRDLPVLRAVAATVAPCRVLWVDHGKRFSVGTGAKCPRNGQFF